MAKLNFDATQVEPAEERDFSPLPAGKYQVAVSETEMKATKAGTGEYLQITFDVQSGEHANRKLWARLNLSNPNKTAEEIAARELSAICYAVGKMQVEDSDELVGLELLVDVGVEINKSNGEPTNRVRGYSAIEVKKPAPRSPAAPTPGKVAAKPWQRQAA
jgi:hypothetical protein